MLIAAFIVGTAGTATADPAPTGSIEGKVWFDRDADGRINGVEPGLYLGWVTLSDRYGNYITGTQTAWGGTYSFPNLAPGVYQVDGKQYNYGFSTPTTRRVTVTADKLSTANFGARGGKITGRSWKDLNANGIREAREPGFSAGIGLTVYNGATTMNADGRYTIDDVALGEATLQSSDGYEGGRMYTQSPAHQGTDPTRDSDFEQGTGRGPTFTFQLGPNGSVRPTTPATADVGYYEAHNTGTLTLTPDRDTTTLHVGGTVTFTGTAAFTGNALDTHAIHSTGSPAGLIFTEVTSTPSWSLELFGSDYFSLRDSFFRVPPPTVTFTVKVAITAPTTGNLTITIGGGIFFESGPATSVTTPINAT
ncbi:hypothetical protein UO65_0805 [Actinokineospora spheciospongiae]|uniref:SD-repeat containing protein B domain-containing protein n=1 Tax=Actinokineospora spheciospongiae TaxID=909613 RepID=W7ISI1_9PSEU|nr:hypothetical protein UO65_0805 [Actinokineospora spheciospongiae]